MSDSDAYVKQCPTVTLTTRITEGRVGPAAVPDSDTHACRMWRLIGIIKEGHVSHLAMTDCDAYGKVRYQCRKLFPQAE